MNGSNLTFTKVEGKGAEEGEQVIYFIIARLQY